MQRRDSRYVLRLELIGRSAGRRRLMDVVKEYMKEVGVSVEDAEMRTGDWLRSSWMEKTSLFYTV